MERPRYLKLPEAAELARASLGTVRHWIATGALKSVRPGKLRLVREDWLEEFMSGASK